MTLQLIHYKICIQNTVRAGNKLQKDQTLTVNESVVEIFLHVQTMSKAPLKDICAHIQITFPPSIEIPATVLAITSTIEPSDGKNTTSFNLAITLITILLLIEHQIL